MSSPASEYPFPTKQPFQPAELTKRFGVVTVEQDPDPAMHFKVVTPLQWGQVSGKRQLVTPKHPFELRTHLKAVSGPEAELKIFIAYVTHEVSPADWLAIYLQEHQEKILHEVYFDQDGGAQPDVLTLGGEKGAERVSRWVVLKDWARIGGGHLFMLQISTPAKNYTADMAGVFFTAISNFDLLHPSDWPYAEQLRTLVRQKPAKLTTAYPMSWQQQENPLSDENFYQVQLTKRLADRQIGRLNLMVLAKQSAADMQRIEQEARAAHAEQKLVFEPGTFAPFPTLTTLRNDRKATMRQLEVPDGKPAQVRTVVYGQAGAYWVYSENISFDRQSFPEDWAVAKRAHEILLKKLTVN